MLNDKEKELLRLMFQTCKKQPAYTLQTFGFVFVLCSVAVGFGALLDLIGLGGLNILVAMFLGGCSVNIYVTRFFTHRGTNFLGSFRGLRWKSFVSPSSLLTVFAVLSGVVVSLFIDSSGGPQSSDGGVSSLKGTALGVLFGLGVLILVCVTAVWFLYDLISRAYFILRGEMSLFGLRSTKVTAVTQSGYGFSALKFSVPPLLIIILFLITNFRTSALVYMAVAVWVAFIVSVVVAYESGVRPKEESKSSVGAGLLNSGAQ